MVLFGGFSVLLRDYVHNRPIAWVSYSAEALKRERAEGRIVLLLVGAQWDLTTALNRKRALETRKVRSFLRNEGVVAMEADWTEPSPEVDAVLKSLDSRSIPLVAIYPAAENSDPVKLYDVITEEQVLKALGEASVKRK